MVILRPCYLTIMMTSIFILHLYDKVLTTNPRLVENSAVTDERIHILHFYYKFKRNQRNSNIAKDETNAYKYSFHNIFNKVLKNIFYQTCAAR